MKVCSNKYEKEAWASLKSVVGIDEAGRGPLAGPLFVAGVIFPIGYMNEEIYDSKAISEKKRERLFQQIQQDANWFKIVEVPIEVIDEKNIYQATKDAMLEIAQMAACDIVLTDAMPLDMTKEVHSLIKGDQKSISIAAASILAKVSRDHVMLALDQKFQGYGLAGNKGYPTKEHLNALKTLGVTEIHRRSYGPVKKIAGE
ncbi:MULTISPECIES: ribonuclease HII [Terrabacteria group]|uniref:ribonuclease HII n=1 Tax=Bacillati TaxID=1783272 RepID=UPI001C6EF76A|nr:MULTISPECIES: ribonuclease HII [Terrabacteria group]MBW9212056.1 ribonuclease HII [Trueperella sp. zg.1013]